MHQSPTRTITVSSGGLLIACSGIDKAQLSAQVPPGCLYSTPQQLEWRQQADGLLAASLDLPINMLAGAIGLVPSLAVPNVDYGFCFALEASFEGCPVSTCLASVGPFPTKKRSNCKSVNSLIRAETDFFALQDTPTQARLTVYVATSRPSLFTHNPVLLTISAQRPTQPTRYTHPSETATTALEVPAKSQMVEGRDIAQRICSPTCVSMILDFFGANTTTQQVANAAYHESSDLYGVWPANIRAATRWGAMGYLLHFPDWQAVNYLLSQHLPIVASVRYDKGELAGSAVAHTAGHLLVVCGLSEDGVHVNDPAALTPESVRRVYDFEELSHVWLQRSAIGYVIFPTNNVKC